MSHDYSKRQLRDAQGRLFWIWAFSLPVILIMIASTAFGTPWPSDLLRDIAFMVLAIPVLFVVGRDELRASSARQGRARSIAGLLVTAVAVTGYFSGLLALVAPVPNFAGIAVVVMAAYSTMCYLKERRAQAAP
jgi:cation transport ATPase